MEGEFVQGPAERFGPDVLGDTVGGQREPPAVRPRPRFLELVVVGDEDVAVQVLVDAHEDQVGLDADHPHRVSTVPVHVVVRVGERKAVADRRARRPAAPRQRGQHRDEAREPPQGTSSGGPRESGARHLGVFSLGDAPPRISLSLRP